MSISFCQALKSNTTLVELNLRRNSLGSLGNAVFVHCCVCYVVHCVRGRINTFACPLLGWMFRRPTPRGGHETQHNSHRVVHRRQQDWSGDIHSYLRSNEWQCQRSDSQHPIGSVGRVDGWIYCISHCRLPEINVMPTFCYPYVQMS